MTPGMHLALTTAVVAGVSWLMILEGMAKKRIVRRPPVAPASQSRFWAAVVALAERARPRRDAKEEP